MLRWLLARRKAPQKQATQPCLCCGADLPASKLVHVNYCYHRESNYLHRDCAGFRLLCSPCHQTIGTASYYEQRFAVLAAADPDAYPWDECLIGLRLHLAQLEALVATGVDPADQERIEILWVSKFRGVRLPSQGTRRTSLLHR